MTAPIDEAVELARRLKLFRYTGETVETDAGLFWKPPIVDPDAVEVIRDALAAERLRALTETRRYLDELGYIDAQMALRSLL